MISSKSNCKYTNKLANLKPVRTAGGYGNANPDRLPFPHFTHFLPSPHSQVRRSFVAYRPLPFSNQPAGWQVFTLLPSPPSKPIVAIGINEQTKQYDHTCYLRILQEFVAWFASRYHFIQGKHYMPAIQRRYG